MKKDGAVKGIDVDELKRLALQGVKDFSQAQLRKAALRQTNCSQANLERAKTEVENHINAVTIH